MTSLERRRSLVRSSAGAWRSRSTSDAVGAQVDLDLALSCSDAAAELALTYFRQGVEASTADGTPVTEADRAVVTGLPDVAERLARLESLAAEHRWAAASLARARGRLTGDPEALAEALTRWHGLDARFEYACTLLLLPDREPEGRAELSPRLPTTEPDGRPHAGHARSAGMTQFRPAAPLPHCIAAGAQFAASKASNSCEGSARPEGSQGG